VATQSVAPAVVSRFVVDERPERGCVGLLRSGKLARRVRSAPAELETFTVCPRDCRVDRSQAGDGRELSADELAALMLELQTWGCHTGASGPVRSLALLDGVVDVYMHKYRPAGAVTAKNSERYHRARGTKLRAARELATAAGLWRVAPRWRRCL
jgi:uncharacterized Fe-S radical SAM superfamily protein PflX